MAPFKVHIRRCAVTHRPNCHRVDNVCVANKGFVRLLLIFHSTYWMAGLAHDAAHFFKFLFIIVLYTLVMTLFVSNPALATSARELLLTHE